MKVAKLPWPREVICGSHKYRVVMDKQTTDALRDEGRNGEVNHRTQQVGINMLRPDSQKTEALLHEALHVADVVFGHGGEDVSEKVVSALSEGMAQILKGWGIEFDWEAPCKDED